jgi:hypothetical protein
MAPSRPRSSATFLAQRLRAAFLNKGLKITLTVERADVKTEKRPSSSTAAVSSEFIKHLDRGGERRRRAIHSEPGSKCAGASTST